MLKSSCPSNKSPISSSLPPGIYPLVTYYFEVKNCVLLKDQSSWKDNKLNLPKEELASEHPRLTHFDWGRKGTDTAQVKHIGRSSKNTGGHVRAPALLKKRKVTMKDRE